MVSDFYLPKLMWDVVFHNVLDKYFNFLPIGFNQAFDQMHLHLQMQMQMRHLHFHLHLIFLWWVHLHLHLHLINPHLQLHLIQMHLIGIKCETNANQIRLLTFFT